MLMLGLASELTGHEVPALLPAGACSFFAGLLCPSLNVWRHVRD
jgi:hypothetical protein